MAQHLLIATVLHACWGPGRVLWERGQHPIRTLSPQPKSPPPKKKNKLSEPERKACLGGREARGQERHRSLVLSISNWCLSAVFCWLLGFSSVVNGVGAFCAGFRARVVKMPDPKSLTLSNREPEAGLLRTAVLAETQSCSYIAEVFREPYKAIQR